MLDIIDTIYFIDILFVSIYIFNFFFLADVKKNKFILFCLICSLAFLMRIVCALLISEKGFLPILFIAQAIFIVLDGSFLLFSNIYYLENCIAKSYKSFVISSFAVLMVWLFVGMIYNFPHQADVFPFYLFISFLSFYTARKSYLRSTTGKIFSKRLMGIAVVLVVKGVAEILFPVFIQNNAATLLLYTVSSIISFVLSIGVKYVIFGHEKVLIDYKDAQLGKFNEAMELFTVNTGAIGQDYFKQLVSLISTTLDVKGVLILSITGSSPIPKPIVICRKGMIVENSNYKFSKVILTISQSQEDFILYQNNLQEKFPEDERSIELGITSLMGRKIRNTNHQVIGLVAVNNDASIENEQLALKIFEVIAARVGLELERIEKEHKIEDQFRKLSILRNIDLMILGKAETKDIISYAVNALLVSYTNSTVGIVSINSYFGLPPALFRNGREIDFDQSSFLSKLADININSATTGTVHLSGDQFPCLSDDFIPQTYIRVPLLSNGKVHGNLELVSSEKIVEDSHDDLSFVEAVAGQLAIAIEGKYLSNQLREKNEELTFAYDETITGWAKALELRDIETQGHSGRVADLIVKLAHYMNIPSDEIVQYKRGALLHDIGKMGIPDSVLLKPGPLTDDEWQIMKQHPSYAMEFLSSVEFLKPAMDIPHFHHEKWDGSGYPKQLKGEEIPLSARIFSIVDVWDALNSNRPYRAPVPRAEIIDIIKKGSGRHFDPCIVEAFLNMIEAQGPSSELVNS